MFNKIYIKKKKISSIIIYLLSIHSLFSMTHLMIKYKNSYNIKYEFLKKIYIKIIETMKISKVSIKVAYSYKN